MTKLVQRIDRWLYPASRDNWDDWLLRERILARIRPGSQVLDLGAGAGILPAMDFRGLGARIHGVDLDPRVVDNPMLDDGRVADGKRIPFEAASFDLVFANNVLEHLSEPLDVFREVARVLRPGGVFLCKTPNRRHYVPSIARATPHWFHGYVAGLRGRSEADTFPTHYRANSRADVTRLAADAGLAVLSVDLIEGRPEYLRVTWPSYLLGALYERTVNATERFAGFRVLLVAAFRK